MSTLAQKLEHAIRHHQQGDLQQAEQLYNQVLRLDPKNVDALHLLGLMAGQFGRHDVAITLILHALDLKPDFADAHNNLGNAYRSQNKLAEAAACYQEALRIKPNYWEAHHNLGVVLHEQGNLPEALTHLRRVIRLKPDFVPARFMLGKVLHKQMKLDDAAASFREVVRLKPDHAEAHNNLGNVLHNQHKLKEAMVCYREAMRLEPALVDALNNLGTAFLDQNYLGDAKECYERALSLKPELAETHSNLGFALRRLGKLSEAIGRCQTAIRLKPGLAEAHTNLADALQEQNRLEEAIVSYRLALSCKPELAETHNNLGNALRKQGKLDEALASYQQALRFKPDYAEAHSNLGNVLRVRGLLDQAVASCQEALRCKPTLASAHNNLGHALQQQGNLDEALASYREALRLEPDFADAHNNLGSALLDNGQIEPALACIREALRLAPDHGMAWHQLGRLGRESKYRFSAAELDQVQQLLKQPKASFKQQALLHFTLAYTSERNEDYDLAFEHYRQGNACKRQSPELWPGFDIRTVCQRVDAAIATFDRKFFERMAAVGHPSDVPVFIVGMPRSGTTLVEQILASHPRFAGAGELLEIAAMAHDLSARLHSSQKYPDCVAQLTRETAWSLAESYLKRLQRDADQAMRVSDKMPLNCFHLGLIALLFPRARIVHCRRDPRDTCVSCFCENFAHIPFSSSLKDLGQFYREYARLMAHWRQVLPIAMFEMQYEELVARPEALCRQLLEFCGLDWDDRCLLFHQSRRPVHSASNLQVRQPMYARSVGRWRRYQTHLGSLLELLAPFLAEATQ